MKVKKIIDNVAVFLEFNTISDYVNDASSSVQLSQNDQDVLNKLVKCVNLVNIIIATEYVPIYITTGLIKMTASGVGNSVISDRVVYDVKKVVDKYGNALKYKVDNGKLICDASEVYITYMVYPKDVKLVDDINDYSFKINERVFAMGVCAEYLYLTGDIDTASSWDTRFKQSLMNCVRNKHSLKIKNRAWY